MNEAVEAVGKPLGGQSGDMFHFACPDHGILNIAPQRH